MIRKRRLCRQQATEILVENKKVTEQNITGKRKCVDLTLRPSVLRTGEIGTRTGNKTPLHLHNGVSCGKQTSEFSQKVDVTNDVEVQSNEISTSVLEKPIQLHLTDSCKGRTTESKEKADLTTYEAVHSNENSRGTNVLRIDSGYDSIEDPDDDDYFVAADIEMKVDSDEPECVSPESPWYRNTVVSDLTDVKNWKSGNPFFTCINRNRDNSSEVYIEHDHATDTVDGDIFGVGIYTDETAKKNNYYRHFFKNVKRDSPADKMKVQNWDELVMVNDTFAPDLNHDQIMKLFSCINVDGVTRFVMVVRRKVSGTSKKWEWFETSAILVPELNKEPSTRHLRKEPLPNNMRNSITPHRYKVKGEQYFLTLTKEGVGVDILRGDKVKDKCKTIWKHAIVRDNPTDFEKLVYEASLSCADQQYFATIDCNAVKVVEDEVFFHYRTMGSDIYFKQGEIYLNCRDRTVGASTEQQFFEEFGTAGHRDVVDGSCISGSAPDSRRITRSMSRQASYTTQLCHMSL